MPKWDGRIRFLAVRPALSCGPFALAWLKFRMLTIPRSVCRYVSPHLV